MTQAATQSVVEDGTHQIQLPQAKKESWLRRKWRVAGFIPETLVLVGAMSVINLAFWPGHPGFIGKEPNPLWVVVLLMASRYGFKAGLFSALVTGGAYMGLVATRITEEVITARDLLSWQYAKPAVLFIAGGVIVGMITQRVHNRLRKQEEDNEELARENLKLRRGEEELRDVNEELANRVVGATDTLPMLYKYAKKLNTLNTDQVFTTLTELVGEVTKSTRTSLYEVKGNQLPLHSRDGKRWDSGPELVLEPGLFEQLVVRRKVLSLHDLLARNITRKDLFLIGPLSAGTEGKVTALLAVEELEFLRYNPATIRLFNVIIDWACASLEKASEFTERPEDLKFQEARTSILRAQHVQFGPATTSAALTPMASGEIGGAGPAPKQSFNDWATGISSGPGGMVLPDAADTMRDEREMEPVATGGFEDHAATTVDMNAVIPGQGLPAELANVPPSAATMQPGAPGMPPGGPPMGPPGERNMLQHMLTGELQIASDKGLPLGKLLTEINSYLDHRKGGPSR